jgi:hypothetical protein
MPVNQEVRDIGSADQLLRYAVAGQLARLLDERGFLDNGLIAQGAGFATSKRIAGQQLARALGSGLTMTAKQLAGLDEVIGAVSRIPDGTGGLSSLALRLSAEDRGRIDVSSLGAHVPSSWTSRLLQDPPVGEIGVLIQASAVLAAFQATRRMDTKGQSEEVLRDRYSVDLKRLVRRLVAVSAAPPTASNYDAQVMLGQLGSYSFEAMRAPLEGELRYSPLGYSVWRAITRVVTASDLQGRRADMLREWVRQLLLVSDELRNRSVYAGRALDMELAIALPPSWSPPGDGDWVRRVLLQRAQDQKVTIGERASAATGLWERSFRMDDHSSKEQAKGDLRGLIAEFRQKPGDRPDCPSALTWIAATLEHVIESGRPVCNDWPVVDDPWYRSVWQAADELDRSDVPAHLLTGAKNLFLHMILQSAGMYRSLAVETVVTSGWSGPVARALGFLLRTEPEAWVRVRAESALGALQRPHDRGTQEDLTHACLRAYESLNAMPSFQEEWGVPDAGRPSRARVSELHAALFAVGDCFGVPGAEAQAQTAREVLREILTQLVNPELPQALVLRRPARAAAYLLTVTAQPCSAGKDFSREMLEKLREHPDPVTSRFSKWALGFRFGPDGSVRPFLAEAEQPLDETPYPLLDAAEEE